MLTTGCALQTELDKFKNQKEKTPEQNVTSQEQIKAAADATELKKQEDFNASGQAKAIIDETDLWMAYVNEEIGFNFKYPHNVSLEKEDGKLLLSLSVMDIDEMENEAPLGFGKKNSLKIRESLLNGEYGEDIDFPLNTSKKARKIKGRNAQDFMVLSRFEVCDVTFERKLNFFIDDYQVILTLKIPKEKIIASMPEFFTTNEENCGEEQIWNFELQKMFYENLSAGAGSTSAVEWFNTFEQIVNTIKFNGEETDTEETLEKISKIDTLLGSWISLDDAKSVIKFTSSTKIDYYENKKMSESNFTLDEEEIYLTVEGDNEIEIYEYEIMELKDDTLKLMFLPRGNILDYEKINY